MASERRTYALRSSSCHRRLPPSPSTTLTSLEHFDTLLYTSSPHLLDKMEEIGIDLKLEVSCVAPLSPHSQLTIRRTPPSLPRSRRSRPSTLPSQPATTSSTRPGGSSRPTASSYSSRRCVHAVMAQGTALRARLMERPADCAQDYIRDETKNLRQELLRAQEEVKRIQSVPLVIGQFLEAVDERRGIVGSTTGGFAIHPRDLPAQAPTTSSASSPPSTASSSSRLPRSLFTATRTPWLTSSHQRPTRRSRCSAPMRGQMSSTRTSVVSTSRSRRFVRQWSCPLSRCVLRVDHSKRSTD